MDLSQQIHHFLSGISLASLVERQEVKDIASRQDNKREKDLIAVGSDQVVQSDAVAFDENKLT